MPEVKQKWEEVKKHYDDFLHYYYNCPCKGCPEGHASMWKSIVESPQWKEWEKVGMYDFAECDELGVMSAGHLQDFLNFCSKSILTSKSEFMEGEKKKKLKYFEGFEDIKNEDYNNTPFGCGFNAGISVCIEILKK